MLNLAIEEKMEVDKIAIESKIKLYATDTFKLIENKYGKDEIFFIMGSDNFRKMPTWKDYEELVKKYNIIVIERDRKKIRKENRENIIEYIPEKLSQIDSTKIREMIKNKDENVKQYLNSKVVEYIIENKLYKI